MKELFLTTIMKPPEVLVNKFLAVKTTCFTQYLSYLNPKGEDSSCKIDGFMAT
jgi:hypothetical protein